MRSYEDLIAEATQADVTGWGFSWLEGRATEERPPWGFARLLAQRLPQARSALDLDTGGGEIIAEMPQLPPSMTVTEAWAPNAAMARTILEPKGVSVVATGTDRLPFQDAAFDLVTSRHPVTPHWGEIARVLTDGGTYFAQHVGPASAFEVCEYFLGPLPENRKARDPHTEAAAARQAGLEVIQSRTVRCRMEFHDIGAMVWTLRKCVWWVPDFEVGRYGKQLRALDASMRTGRPFIAHSSRTLIEARRRPR